MDSRKAGIIFWRPTGMRFTGPRPTPMNTSKTSGSVLKKNDNGSYSIILGQERSKTKAESIKEELTRRGIFTSLKRMKIDSRIYIVRVGSFDSNTNAVQNQKKIETMGYTGTLIRKKS